MIGHYNNYTRGLASIKVYTTNTIESRSDCIVINICKHIRREGLYRQQSVHDVFRSLRARELSY